VTQLRNRQFSLKFQPKLYLKHRSGIGLLYKIVKVIAYLKDHFIQIIERTAIDRFKHLFGKVSHESNKYRICLISSFLADKLEAHRSVL